VYQYSIEYPPTYTVLGFSTTLQAVLADIANQVTFKRHEDAALGVEDPNALTISVIKPSNMAQERAKLEDPDILRGEQWITSVNRAHAEVYDGFGSYTIDKIVFVHCGKHVVKLRYPKDFGYEANTSDRMIASFRCRET
jgi:hypothetical protein